MKFHQHLLALFLAGFMAFAHAAPETMPDGETDPIARFAAPGEEAAGDLLLQAMSLIGVAYRFGGSNPESGLDCSGFIQYVFKKSLRVTLPRTAAGMAQVGREIDRDELKAGDLVFFNTRGFRYSHVGIYLGNNKFIHAPRTGKNIEVANMSQSYWTGRYNGARRVSRGSGLPAAAPETDKPAATALAEKSASRKEAASRKEVASKATEGKTAGKRSYRHADAQTVAERNIKGKKKKAAQDDEPVRKGKKGKKASQDEPPRSKKAGKHDSQEGKKHAKTAAADKKKPAGKHHKG